MTDQIRIEPADPEAARAEIERTRARMSETIDEIEDVLVRKKERLQDQLDVRARVRENPLAAAGIVLGAGLLLGLVTGGKKSSRPRLDAEERAALWESRARRVLAIAREQEEDIEELEAILDAHELEDEEEYEEYDEYEVLPVEEGPSRWTELREEVGDRLGAFVADAAHQLIEGVKART
jgi:hypothetical protein